MPVLHFWLTDVVFVYSQHLLKVEQHFWPCLCLFIHACFDFLVAHDCCREWCIAYFPNTTIHLLITMCVLLLPIFESLHAFLVGSLTMLIFVMFVQKQSWLGQQVLDDDNNDDGDTGWEHFQIIFLICLCKLICVDFLVLETRIIISSHSLIYLFSSFFGYLQSWGFYMSIKHYIIFHYPHPIGNCVYHVAQKSPQYPIEKWILRQSM